MTPKPNKKLFAPTHVFVLPDDVYVPVMAEMRSDWVAYETDGTVWATNMGVMDCHWTCRSRGVTTVVRVEATLSPFTFKEHLNGYDVHFSGTYIGHVYKWERRYNLRRVTVTKGWRARGIADNNLHDSEGYTATTRLGAAIVLLKVYNHAYLVNTQ